MSNLIKSNHVYLNGEDKKIIDSNGKEFEILRFTKTYTEVKSQDLENSFVSPSNEEAIFTEGIKATVIEPFLSEEVEATKRKEAEQIIAEAKEQAKQILEEANREAEERSSLLFEEASRKGYDEGLQRAVSEVNQAKMEYEELKENLNRDYMEQIATLEPQYGQIISEMIEKLTGIIVEDKKEVILYLLHNAIIKSENSKSYIIRVSKEDYDFVITQKEELYQLVNGEISLEIAIDKELIKNQCLIETDTRIIDCSLDIQLSNLIQDIKILSNQRVEGR